MKMFSVIAPGGLCASLMLLCFGSFFTSSILLGADTELAVVQKGVDFVQDSAGPPALDPKNGAFFETLVKTSGSNLVTSVTLKPPGTAPAAVPQTESDEFKLKQKHDTQSELDSGFPNGTYTLTVDTVHDGSRTLSFALTGDAYPNVPHLSNFDATQGLDAGAYFLFTWDAFQGGQASDFVQLHIEDDQGKKVWETPDFGEPGALDGRATAALLSPETLAAGASYQAMLTFGKTVVRDAASYPGALGAALYLRRTKFIFNTSAGQTAPDLHLYLLTKARRFQQIDSGAPTLQTTDKAFNLDATAQGASTGAVMAASLLLPSGTAKSLIRESNKSFAFEDDALLQTALDAIYPNGQYAFQVVTPSGTKNATLSLSGDAYPDAPYVSSPFSSPIDPGAAFAITWAPFERGTSTDFIQLHIEEEDGNKVFETADLGKEGALDGTALGAIVPANTLFPGRTYDARLVFQKNVSFEISGYPGALGIAGYASRTSFVLVAAGNAQPALRLSALAASGSGEFRLGLQGPPGRSFRIDVVEELGGEWLPVSTNALTVDGTFVFPDGSAKAHRFYRAALLP